MKVFIADFFENEAARFYLILLVCLLLRLIPYLGKYIAIVGTLIHEFGHILVALLLGEKPLKINLFTDSSGEALVRVSSGFKKVLIAMAGYPFVAFTAWLSYWILSNGYHYYYLIAMTVLSLFILVLYVRNVFGIIWMTIFVLLNAVVVYYQQFALIEILAQAYAAIIFIEAIISCFPLLYLSFKSPKKAGDASNIAAVTHFPAPLVGIFLSGINFYIIYLVFMRFFSHPL